jgi:hypothetical protein
VPQTQVPLEQVSAFVESQAMHALPPVPQAEALAATHWLPLQQAPAERQLVESHTHLAPEQCWPATHAAPPPQVQPVDAQPSDIVGSQALQALLPLAGHCVNVGGLTQLLLASQQPPAQVEAVQRQAYWSAPPTKKQPWPAGQGGWLPQPQVLPLKHVSTDWPLFVQSTQAAPPSPQVVAEGAWQVLPPQQPNGHEVALQTHAPATHCWPAVQAAPEPHWQAPAALQASARMPQSTHAAPETPQVERVRGWQAPLTSQQPAGHEAPSQTHCPPAQRCPGAQPPSVLPQLHWPKLQLSVSVVSQLVWQVLPLSPQVEGHVGFAVHAFPRQQPGQEAPSHTQTPAAQRWPGWQGAAEPQLQSPVVAEQLSAVVLSQVTHEAPLMPHAESERGMQVLPASQQPSAQETASQTHWSARQR